MLNYIFINGPLTKCLVDIASEFGFGLVFLFNGISTLCRLFNAKAILLEEQ